MSENDISAFAALDMMLAGYFGDKPSETLDKLLDEAREEHEWLKAMVEAQAEELRADKPTLPILTDNDAAPQIFGSDAVSKVMKDRFSRLFPGLGDSL